MTEVRPSVEASADRVFDVLSDGDEGWAALGEARVELDITATGPNSCEAHHARGRGGRPWQTPA